MSEQSQKMNLTLWNSLSDPYDSSELVGNFQKIDTHTHVAGEGNQIPSDGIEDGAITSDKIANGSIVNNDINSSANIAYSKLNLSNSIQSSDIDSSAAIPDSKLATISTAGKVANSATTATSSSGANSIVTRDASSNFSANVITASLSGNASTATQLQTARQINGVAFDGTSNISISGNPTSYSTSLPSSPIDGQEVYYAADQTNGIIWHLRYRSGSSSSYKWEFLGGTELQISDAITLSATSTNWSFGTGLTMTAIPLTGDYEITISAESVASGTTNAAVRATTTYPTTLTEEIGNSSGSQQFTVADSSLINLGDYLLIDSEQFLVTANDGLGTIQADRQQAGTAKTSHFIGAIVYAAGSSTGGGRKGIVKSSFTTGGTSTFRQTVTKKYRENKLVSGLKIYPAVQLAGSATSASIESLNVYIKPIRVTN